MRSKTKCCGRVDAAIIGADEIGYPVSNSLKMTQLTHTIAARSETEAENVLSLADYRCR